MIVEIDKKWQSRWAIDRLYESNLNGRGPRFYLLSMFPYPSGNLHLGHWYALSPADAIARFQRMKGYNVFFPIGFDAFGLPAENAAIKHGVQPSEWTEKNIAKMTEQLKSMGCMFSNHTLKTCDPAYYKWNQKLFLEFHKAGLVYRNNAPVDFCPSCNTTIAKEQIVNGGCERCDTQVVEKKIPSWKLRITKYKEELKDFTGLDWPQKVIKMQRSWIENLRDWNVSRQRMWGTPIPIIHCRRCGVVPVPESDLPVLLPTDADFIPGVESPLKRHPTFKDCACPQCGYHAERETDTLDTFFDSSWYQYGYLGLDNPFHLGRLDWAPVNLYTGGIEHACMHLLYFRFFTKALNDIGLVPFREPAQKLFNQGMILGPDGQKMSKSRGNVIDPDELVEEYGADVVRAALMFAGPWDEGGPWLKNLTGVVRFLDDVDDMAERAKPSGAGNQKLSQLMSRTIKKVEESYREFKFNVALASLMSLRNEMMSGYQTCGGTQWGQLVECMLLMLSPMCPHRTEEQWRKNHTTSIHSEPYPLVLAAFNDEIKQVVVQVDGKKKFVVEWKNDYGPVAEFPEVKELIAGLEVIKTINVEGRLVNFVTKKVRTIDD